VRRPSAQAPVSTHPAFPAIVASWFAALLGLGSLALPAALLESLVALTGLRALIPSAAPPLGFTAHAAIALGAAGIGALIGCALARKVAETRPAEPQPPQATFDEVRKCRPILAHDELGEEGLAPAPDVPEAPTKRRSLAAGELGDHGVELPIVPLPGRPADEPAAFAEFIDRRRIDKAEAPVPQIAGRPLAELGLLQLTERLGASLANRAARLATSPAGIVADPPFARTAHPEAAGAEDAAKAIADFFGPGRAPRADSRSESLEGDFGEPIDDGDYSSLLAMKNPFTR
jgi:hypothetical protein